MECWRAPGLAKSPGVPTGRFGRTIDWFLVTHGLATARATVWPGFPSEDHVPVGLTIPAEKDLDLGARVRCPANIPVDAGEPQEATFDLYRAEQSWETWTDVAEEYLSHAYGVTRGAAKRG